MPLQSAVADGPYSLNVMLPPAVEVTPDRVALSDTLADGSSSTCVATVVIAGLAFATTVCSSPQVDEVPRLLASPL